VKIVLPQYLPIPTNAVYRKYTAANGWIEFVVDANNRYASSPGDVGYCPPPNDISWTDGLTQGHWCVQLTLEDGGPNDDDGLANRTIVDPGGVAVWASSNNLPSPQADSLDMLWNTDISIDVLANDSDEDGDTLTIVSAQVDFGEVEISNEQLLYTPAASFFGVATINYGVSDNNGGSGFTTVSVNVVDNAVPVANNDTATTDDRSAITIDVLANDSDEDGDSITIAIASAQNGTVTITAQNTLRYTPLSGFSGTDIIDYTVDDGSNSQASAQVSVRVNAYQSIALTNTSGGGSMAYILLFLCALFMVRQQYARKTLWAVLVLSLSSFSTQANWQLNAAAGYAKAKGSVALTAALPTGVISQIDESDISGSLGVAYQFDNGLSVGLNYIDMGQGRATITVDTIEPEQYHRAVAEISPVLVSGTALQLGYRFWQREQVSATLIGGILAWEGDTSSEYGDQLIKTPREGSDAFYGIAAHYHVTEQWQLGLGITRYQLAANNVDVSFVSLSYLF